MVPCQDGDVTTTSLGTVHDPGSGIPQQLDPAVPTAPPQPEELLPAELLPALESASARETASDAREALRLSLAKLRGQRPD